MDIKEIVTFWRGQQEVDETGRWAHRFDRKVLNAGPHGFNLSHPVSPYVGDVLTAPVIILGANAKYDPAVTPSEFSTDAAVEAYVRRVDAPSEADWSFVSSYYDETNYGHLVGSGKAALINACSYRSPKLSEEPENRKLIQQLPSCTFTRRWLLEAVLPSARAGERMIVVKRGGQWKLPSNIGAEPGVVTDPAPVSPRITSTALEAMNAFLSRR